MAGITWGISGSIARSRAREEAVETIIETERMACTMSGLKAIANRIAEGEALLYALSKKLRKSLAALRAYAVTDGGLSEEAARELDTSVRLIVSLKNVIETDICNAEGLLTKKSGVVFRKIEREVGNA
jgi:hypothetical protein